MRAFVSLRRMLAGNQALARRLAELERRLEGHDASIRSLFEAIRQLMAPPPAPPKPEIGLSFRKGQGRSRIEPAKCSFNASARTGL